MHPGADATVCLTADVSLILYISEMSLQISDYKRVMGGSLVQYFRRELCSRSLKARNDLD